MDQLETKEKVERQKLKNEWVVDRGLVDGTKVIGTLNLVLEFNVLINMNLV